MEMAADKLLSLPMQQPRKIKQVHGVTGGWRWVAGGEARGWDRMFLEAWEALEDPKRGESNNRDPSLHLNSPQTASRPTHPCIQSSVFGCGRGELGGMSAEQEVRGAFL